MSRKLRRVIATDAWLAIPPHCCHLSQRLHRETGRPAIVFAVKEVDGDLCYLVASGTTSQKQLGTSLVGVFDAAPRWIAGDEIVATHTG